MSDERSTEPKTIYDQHGQTIYGDQTNIAGGVYYRWPKVAVGAALLALLAFGLLLLQLASNLIEQSVGLTLQQLLWGSGAIAASAWLSALLVLRAKHNVGESYGYANGDINRPLYRQEPAFIGWYRRSARIALWTIPLLVGIVGLAYYVWIITPAQYTTILLADFVAPSGSDEALVTQTLFDAIDKTMAGLPTESSVAPLRIKRLHRVIDGDGGSEQARQIGSQPQHKATIVIWGNYAIVDGDPEVHLHFDIVQPADTYLGSGFASSYGPNQISQLLQIEQQTMFDFKLLLGKYLGQMTVFTIGLTLFNADRNKEAISYFEKAGEAIGQQLASDFERGIRFYRGANYLSLGRAKDAKPDLEALIPEVGGKSGVFDLLALAALENLGRVEQNEGDYAAAKSYYDQILEFCRQLGYPLGEPAGLGGLGSLAWVQGDYATAKSYHEQALEITRQLGSPLGEAQALHSLGYVAWVQGDYAAAKSYHEQALEIYHQLGNPHGEAAALGSLGSLAQDEGDYVAAKSYHEQALGIDRQLGYPLGEAQDLGDLGYVAWVQGDNSAAKSYHEQALEIYRQLGIPHGEAAALASLGDVARSQGDYAAAKEYYEQSAELFRSIGLPVHPVVQFGLEQIKDK